MAVNKKYREFSRLNLPEIEQEILADWTKNDAFKKSVTLREGAPSFVFYEGPPSANGMPGIHHVISRTLKDIVCRYKTMQGFQVRRKGGWDTHGLPVELGVEKELGITKEDIGKTISVEGYNKKCREAVLRYKGKWDELTNKMGYWVDLDNPYITFENKYVETLWWLLNQLYKKGLLYESVSIQPYSPAAGTGLSSHELNQPGTYKNVKDTTAVVMFKIVENEQSKFIFNKTSNQQPTANNYFLAWTTTPWTLPANLGLTVGANIDYVLVNTLNQYTQLPVNVVLAKALVHKHFKAEGENLDSSNYKEGDKIIPWKIIAEFKGKDIEGCEYEQLMPYEANSLNSIKQSIPDAKPFRVLIDSFVTTEDGTGIVHTAPDFGADDYKVGTKYNLGFFTTTNKRNETEKLILVDREGKFVDGLGEFSNRYVKNYKDDPNYEDVNVDICVMLKKENKAFKVEKYEHSYPHCWRTDKPVLYYPLDAWFIKTSALKDRMVELNKTINWKPKSTGEGRFGNWLENMIDWNLSRSRFWGTPLPIWRTEDGDEEICIGSIEELEKHIDPSSEIKKVDDLHKPFVDRIILTSPKGKKMYRVPDLIDVWFDSGAMPYAQWGLPKNKPASEVTIEDMANHISQCQGTTGRWNGADFIAEGVDQTRGWFYTLHAIASMLFDTPAYRTVVSNGLVLDKNGNKMSKRLGNVVDPFKTIADFGADATRWYLITNASPWDNLKFDLEGIREIQRKFFGTLYNTYQFFALYANSDNFSFKEDYIPVEKRPEIDKWILSSLNSLINTVTEALNDYEPTLAGRAIDEFVDEHLSNWYVRLCRRRFWKGEYAHDKICAYQTLYECLETIALLMAPIAPFFSDAVFQNLNNVSGRFTAESIHHIAFPKANASVIDSELEERMQLAQDASSLILSLRKKVNIKVRQPLQKVLIPVLNPEMKYQLQKIEDLIKAEVNIKEIEYITETEGIISKKIKPNFKILGAKLGGKMKSAAAAISQLSQQDIAQFEKESCYTLNIDKELVKIELQDVEITAEDIPGWSVANKGKLTVALDITITDNLRREGNAREFVNRIQNIRKDKGLDLSDRISVMALENDFINEFLNEYKTYICEEILADNIDFLHSMPDGTEIEVNDVLLKVSINKKEE